MNDALRPDLNSGFTGLTTWRGILVHPERTRSCGPLNRTCSRNPSAGRSWSGHFVKDGSASPPGSRQGYFAPNLWRVATKLCVRELGGYMVIHENGNHH